MNKKLIIYDWDDTLFPTSWLKDNGINIDNNDDIYKYKLYFQEIDNIIYSLLLLSIKYGKVLIITNAQKIWVKKSAEICLPKSYEIIIKYINVISANEVYSNIDSDIRNWKVRLFNNLNYFDKKITDIINIGDSYYEYYALVKLQYNTNCKNKYLKNIKFVSNPTYDEFVDEHKIFKKNLYKICNKNTHIDLNFKLI
jgi:hypothetical protein